MNKKIKLTLLLILSGFFLIIIKFNILSAQKEIQNTQAKAINNQKSQNSLTPILCNFRDPTDQTLSITTYIKGPFMKIDGLLFGKNSKGTAIIKYKRVWVWSQNDKKGITFLFTRNNQVGKPYKILEDNPQGKINMFLDMVENEGKDYCKKYQNINNTMFLFPSNVVFTKI